MMKKIFFVFSFLIFIQAGATQVHAECNPTKYNQSKSYTVDLNSVQLGAKKSCNSKDDCEAFRSPSTLICWPPGATTANPTCPTGYGPVAVFLEGNLFACTAFKDQCCETNWTGNCVDKDTHTALAVCADVGTKANLTNKTKCGDAFKINEQTGVCEQILMSAWDLKNTCDNNTVGVQTGIGCIPTNDLRQFLGFILRWALGISGGIILLMLMATGYSMMTSTGNPEKLQAVKENLVSIFSGLILIGFSLILLQTIGADILKLPTF